MVRGSERIGRTAPGAGTGVGSRSAMAERITAAATRTMAAALMRSLARTGSIPEKLRVCSSTASARRQEPAQLFTSLQFRGGGSGGIE